MIVLLKKLFSIKNAAPLLVIAVAFPLTFFDIPFLGRDKVIIALLGLLAINALLDRIYLTGELREKVESIDRTVSNISAEHLGFRGEFGTTEDLLLQARKEIWISGVALDGVSRLTGLFEQQIQSGVAVRFLAISQDSSVVNGTAKFFGDDPHDLSSRLQTNLRTLHRRLVSPYPEMASLRTFSHRPSLGYFIIDPHTEFGYMRVETYISKTEQHERPMFQLFKGKDKSWFEVYRRDFENLWSHAQDWSLEKEQ
jgi:hypothetical protein